MLPTIRTPVRIVLSTTIFTVCTLVATTPRDALRKVSPQQDSAEPHAESTAWRRFPWTPGSGRAAYAAAAGSRHWDAQLPTVAPLTGLRRDVAGLCPPSVLSRGRGSQPCTEKMLCAAWFRVKHSGLRARRLQADRPVATSKPCVSRESRTPRKPSAEYAAAPQSSRRGIDSSFRQAARLAAGRCGQPNARRPSIAAFAVDRCGPRFP